MHELLTVLIQTSPIPSHPSTALLEALFRSFEKADGLLESRIIILADGCETLDNSNNNDGSKTENNNNNNNAIETENIKHGKCYSKTAENYKRHLKLLEQAVKAQTPPFCPHTTGGGGSIELVRLETRHGSAPAIRAAMSKFVSTPLVMICQHDNFFVNEAPLREVVHALLREPRGLGIGAHCVHFLSTATLNYREKIKRRYKLDIGKAVRVKHLKDPLLPLVFWYGRSHVTYSDYVRSHCLNRELAPGSHLEELLGEKQLHDILKGGGMDTHREKYGTYVLDQGHEVLYHMSGRRVKAANSDDDDDDAVDVAVAVTDSSPEISAQNQATTIRTGITTRECKTNDATQEQQQQRQQQPLEGSFTTARETIAKVPGLAFIMSEGEKQKGANNNKSNTNTTKKKPFKQKCFYCGVKGHSKKFCPKRETCLLTEPPAPEIIEL